MAKFVKKTVARWESAGSLAAAGGNKTKYVYEWVADGFVAGLHKRGLLRTERHDGLTGDEVSVAREAVRLETDRLINEALNRAEQFLRERTEMLAEQVATRRDATLVHVGPAGLGLDVELVYTTDATDSSDTADTVDTADATDTVDTTEPEVKAGGRRRR